MEIVFLCEKCGKEYPCLVYNTRIHSPYIETRCPFCNKLLTRNISAFVEKQAKLKGVVGRLSTANFMIKMANLAGREVNDDIPYRNSRGKIKRDELPKL